MSSRNTKSKGGQNNIDRIYNLNRWLSFQQEQMEKRFTLEIQQRQRYQFIGIVLFNVFHIIYAFLSTNQLSFIIFPALRWLMIICLLFSVGIIQLHKQCIEKNQLFQLFIRLSSLYFYCSNYLNVDQLEMEKTSTIYLCSSLAVSIHMVLTNLLTLPHWKQHVIANLLCISIVQLIVFLSSHDSLIKLNIVYFLIVQVGLHIFAGFNELFIREFWIHLDVSKKQSIQLQTVIDELPQPLLVVDAQNDIQLSNFQAIKFFQSILPAKEESLLRNIAQNPQKILHRINTEDLQIIENLVKQVKESQNICTKSFQKEIKKQDTLEKDQIQLANLTLIGSQIQWKSQVCTLIQIYEAEKIIEKEIEQKTITIERVYEIQNQQSQIETKNLQKNENNLAQIQKGMTEQEITSIQFVQHPPTRPLKTLTQVDNVISISISGNNDNQNQDNNNNINNKMQKDVYPDIKVNNKIKQKKIVSPDQSPINFTSPTQKSSDDISHLISTQENSDGEININIDDEIYKQFSFIESGLSNLLAKIISQIQGIKGKKINLSFGSVENSPNIKFTGSDHNISGNKINTAPNNNDTFNPHKIDENESLSPLKAGSKEDTKINKKALLLQEDLKKSDNNISKQQSEKKSGAIHDIINQNKDQIVLNDYSDEETNDTTNNNISIVIQKPNNSLLNISHSGTNTPLLSSNHKITEIKEEPEEDVAISKVPIKREQFKFNEQLTIVLFEESSNTRLNPPYVTYDHPAKFITFSEGDKVLSHYFENIDKGHLFHLMILGIEAEKGINGIDIITKIRAYERENLIPRTHIVALFNSVGQEVGEKTKSTDTYLFKGFDQAFEKPINRTIMNDIIKERLNPQIIFLKEEDYLQKYSYLNKFTVLICDDQIQTAMIFKEYALSLNVEVEIVKSEKQLLNHYYSQIDTGRLYQIIMIAINSIKMSGIEIVKKIREYEKKKKTKRTFIVGMFKSLNETIGNSQRSNSPLKYKEEGFDEIVVKPLEKEAVSNLIEKVKKRIQQEELNRKNGQKSSSLNQIKSLSQLHVEKSNSKSSSLLKISPLLCSKSKDMNMDDNQQQSQNNLTKKTKESGIKIYGNSSLTEFSFLSSGSKNQFKKEDLAEQNKLSDSNLSSSSRQSFSINILKTPPINRQQQNSRSSLDILKRNASKSSISDDQSKVMTQPSPQQNRNQQSPNINKKLGQKSESQRHSPMMSISKIQTSPVQKFNGKPNMNQVNMQFVQNKPSIQFKYNEKPTFLVMEDSSLVMMNISFMKYDIPQTHQTTTNGQAALDKYMNNIKNNILYHFIILGVNIEKGMNGNEVMSKIRQHEKENNLPRTYLIASYNSITSEIGGQTYNKETFLFRGFDDALEKPIKAIDMNNVLKQRANPQIIYAKKEDNISKYRFFDKFSILVSDEADQITLTVSSLEVDNIEKPVFTWNGQSLFNKYISSIQAGRIYSFILTGIRTLDLKQEDVVKKIRQYEKENNIPQTYIIGFMRQQQKNQPTVEELLQEGYSDIIDCSISQEDLIKIITKLRLTLKIKL